MSETGQWVLAAFVLGWVVVTIWLARKLVRTRRHARYIEAWAQQDRELFAQGLKDAVALHAREMTASIQHDFDAAVRRNATYAQQVADAHALQAQTDRVLKDAREERDYWKERLDQVLEEHRRIHGTH